MSEERLRIEGLGRLGFGPFALALADGECVAVTGRSGSGKSLLLRMIVDLDPHVGEAWCAGARRSAVPAPLWRRRVSYVAAQSGWWSATVADHFAMREAAAALALRLGLAAAILDAPVERLSTGEKQRLALVRALVQRPLVLLLDEPTASLDGESTSLVEAVLHGELSRGTAILLVTHDPQQAVRLAGRHLRMSERQLVAAPAERAL